MKSSLPIVSILIVGYNSEKHIENCLRSIPRDMRSSIELFFINNSNDSASEVVRSVYPDALIVPTHGNVGFGAGVNLLASYARAPFFLLLNPDAVIIGNSLQQLISAAVADPCVGVWGGLAVLQSGEIDNASVQDILTPSLLIRSIFGIHTKKVRSLADAQLVASVVSGAFLLIRREAWLQVGGFDQRFFLYAEEHDLCRRVSALGWKLRILPAAKFHHDTGSGARRNPLRFEMRARGNVTYFRKYYGPAMSSACVVLMYAHALSRVFAGWTTGNRDLAIAYWQLVSRPRNWMNGW